MSNLLSIERLGQQGWVPSYSESVTPEAREMHLDRGDVRLIPTQAERTLLAAGEASDCECQIVHDDCGRTPVSRYEMAHEVRTSQRTSTETARTEERGYRIKASDFEKPLKCISCQMTKQKRNSYKRHEKCSKVRFERLMSDVCYVGLETIGGNRYFQLI